MSYLCPGKESQDKKKIKKWSDGTRVMINFEHSSRHALPVSFILNIQIGLLSPPYHT
jgi:hypothetical protein